MMTAIGPRPRRRTGASRLTSLLALTGVALTAIVLAPAPALAHPLGNFSISQYTGIRLTPNGIELRYLVDMAEIPTFQEMQDTGIVPEPGHPSLSGYLARKVDQLRENLSLELDGRRVPLQVESKEIAFPPGAGGLPTLKLRVLYRGVLPRSVPVGLQRLRYRDGNFPGRAGWKEIIAVADDGITVTGRSVPAKDRSQELSDYPTDLLNSPPQTLEAQVVFARGQPAVVAGGGPPDSAAPAVGLAVPEPLATGSPPRRTAESTAPQALPGLEANKQGTPRSAFTELVTAKDLNVGVILIALGVSAALGAFHALEPGHGKTVVAAFLVGSRGTAWHAVLLGLIVTASHTAGVYLLGAVTLFASRYVMPERLYPWLGAFSGTVIAVLGFTLFLRRYAQLVTGHTHAHSHEHGHAHAHDHPDHEHDAEHAHHQHAHGHAHSHPHPGPGGAVTLPGLVGLGISGGIVPCPAALVVLLSALSLNRVGFGLLLIVAFSVGLAVVLIAIGLLMVYAGRVMTRFTGEGPLIQRWLPLASSVVITIFGVGMTLQALMTGGILQVRF